MGEKRIRRVTVIPSLTTLSTGEMRKRKVAAYARVSTSSDEQEGSLIAQRDYYEKRIQANSAWDFVEVYFDDGISGLSFRNRDGFNRMVEDALAGKIDLILTKSLSRFARNTVDTLKTIRLLKENKVEVYFEKENIYTFDSKGEFLITLMSSFAQEESRSISENITWGKRKQFADGKYTMPYKNFLGYEKGEKGTPIIVAEEATIVRLIYLLYLEGFTVYKIKHYLNSIEIPSPMGSTWRESCIDSMLRNEKYKGDALLQKTITVDFLTKKRKINEGEAPQYYLDDAHPAIVSKEVWNLVQEEMARRGNCESKYSYTATLAGKIVCESCGGFYGLKSSKRSGVLYGMFWRCNNYYTNECESMSLREETIDDFCKLAIGDLFLYYEDVIKFCAELLSQCKGIDKTAVTEATLKEWFVYQLDCVFMDSTTLRTLIYQIYPVGHTHVKIITYDGLELTFLANKKGKKMQYAAREVIDNRSAHIATIAEAPTTSPKTEKVTMPQGFSVAEQERIKELRLSGETYISIANAMGASLYRVQQFCKKSDFDKVVSRIVNNYKFPVRPKIRVADDLWTKIYVMRTAGYSLKRIHEITGVNQDTIKTRCHRYGLSGNYTLTDNGLCKYCGKVLEHTQGKRKKEFCCDNCRNEWWSLQRRAQKIEREFMAEKR